MVAKKQTSGVAKATKMLDDGTVQTDAVTNALISLKPLAIEVSDYFMKEKMKANAQDLRELLTKAGFVYNYPQDASVETMMAIGSNAAELRSAVMDRLPNNFSPKVRAVFSSLRDKKEIQAVSKVEEVIAECKQFADAYADKIHNVVVSYLAKYGIETALTIDAMFDADVVTQLREAVIVATEQVLGRNASSLRFSNV